MAKQTKLTGRAWVIADPSGKLIDDIDTDMIFHNAHLAITDIAQMGQHAFGNLENWKDFSQKANKGDILIVGNNFGAGSSRQQAVDCFTALGISVIVGESFGAIYKRNAINSGFPLVTGSSLPVEDGETITVDLENGVIVKENGTEIPVQPFSKVQMDIYKAGSLFAYGKSID